MQLLVQEEIAERYIVVLHDLPVICEKSMTNSSPFNCFRGLLGKMNNKKVISRDNPRVKDTKLYFRLSQTLLKYLYEHQIKNVSLLNPFSHLKIRNQNHSTTHQITYFLCIQMYKMHIIYVYLYVYILYVHHLIIYKIIY